MKTATINGLEITVSGLRELKEFSTAGITHLVSIWGGLDAQNADVTCRMKAAFPEACLHYAFFDDVIDLDAHCSPTEEAIRSILAFTGSLTHGDRLLIHCTAGISRSTAVAFAALCQHWGPGYEIECFVELKWMRPRATPNPLVVRLADFLLKRGEEMVKALNCGG